MGGPTLGVGVGHTSTTARYISSSTGILFRSDHLESRGGVGVLWRTLRSRGTPSASILNFTAMFRFCLDCTRARVARHAYPAQKNSSVFRRHLHDLISESAFDLIPSLCHVCMRQMGRSTLPTGAVRQPWQAENFPARRARFERIIAFFSVDVSPNYE